MDKKHTSLKLSKVLSTSENTKVKLAVVSNKLKGTELFSNKIESARKSLSGLKSLPI